MAQTTIQGSFLGDATVTGAKIGADFISAQTALTTGLATTDEIIVSDAGVIKRMDISVLALSAAQLTSGTIPDARFPATLPAISGANLTNLPASGATLATSTNNQVVTVTGSNAMTGEANLTFDGTNLTVATGNVIIGTAGKGIDFSAQTATSTGTTTAEILDHYEEGTWTPQVSRSNNDGTGGGQVYTVQVGNYTKIGRLVHFACRLTMSTLGLGTSEGVRILGLPFTHDSRGNNEAAVNIGGYVGGVSITASESMTGYIPTSQAQIRLTLWNATTGTGTFGVNLLTDSFDMMISGSYTT